MNSLIISQTVIILLTIALISTVVYYLYIKPFLHEVDTKARNKEIRKYHSISIPKNDVKAKVQPGRRRHSCKELDFTLEGISQFIEDRCNETTTKSVNDKMLWEKYW